MKLKCLPVSKRLISLKHARRYLSNVREKEQKVTSKVATTTQLPDLTSTPISASPELPENTLSYQDIIKGMESRNASYFKIQGGRYAPTKNIINRFGNVSYKDFIKTPEVGDLVLSKYSGPLVLLQTSKEKDFLACDPSGIVLSINKASIAFSLGNLVAPSHLATCVVRVDVDGTPLLCLTNVMKRALCPVLRSLIGDKYSQWDELLPIIQRQISGLNKMHKSSINIPFFQLAQEIQKCIEAVRSSPESITVESQSIQSLAGKFPPPKCAIDNLPTVPATLLFSLYEAVNMVFDRDILVNRDVLTLLPKEEVVKFESALLQANDPSQEVINKLESNNSLLIKRFAIGDISPHDDYSLSATLSLLRKLSSFKDFEDKIQPINALELQTKRGFTDQKYGPFFDSYKYDFLKSSIPPVSFNYSEYDRLDNLREDLGKDISVYCIDAKDSHEIDDGVSITQLFGSKVLIGIHIADPTSNFKDLNDNLLQQAYNKTSSAYFPSGAITMFPEQFTNKFSLETNLGERKCLTISFVYDEAKQKLIEDSTEIRPQLIKNIVNITYDDVNKILDKSSNDFNDNRTRDLSRLQNISKTLLTNRFNNGAIDLSIENVSVKIEPETGEEIQISDNIEPTNKISISPNPITPAHSLVSELMIKANSLIAEFTKKNSIPNIYRTQTNVFPTNQPRSKSSFQLLQSMRPSMLSTTPALHQSLGVNQYSSASSPLRRFQDIITHWQLYSHLLNLQNDLLTPDQLNTIILKLQTTQTIINSAQRKSLNYWVLKQLESSKTIPIKCTIASPFSTTSSSQRIYLSDYGIYGIIDTTIPLPIGKKLICTISKINSITNTLKLSPLN